MPDYTVGWVYNLQDENATTDAGSLITVAITFAVIATLAVALRFYVRLSRVSKSLALDDWIALIAVILCDIHSGVVVYQTRWGQALDPIFFPMQNLIPFGKVQFTGGNIYCVCLVGFKLSLLATYYRVGGFLQLYRKIIVAVAIMVTLSAIFFTFLLSFACKPIPKAWNPMLEGECINRVAAYYALGVLNIIFDIAIVVLPFPIIAKLKMSWKRKAGLVAMLALGLIITIAQIVRMTFVYRLFEQSDSAELIKWSVIEINLGILVACIPTYAPLVMSSRDNEPSYNINSKTRTPRSNKFGAWVSSKASSLGLSKNSNSYNSKHSAVSHVDPIHPYNKNIMTTTEWSQVVEFKRNPEDSPV